MKDTLGSDSCCQVAGLTSLQEGLDTSDKETEGTGADHEGTAVVAGTAASVRMPWLAASRGEYFELQNVLSDQLQQYMWFGDVQIL